MGKKSKSSSSSTTTITMTKEEAGAMTSSPEVMSLIEQHVGSKLLTGPNEVPKPTASVLKGTDSVLLYFAASWSSASNRFTPILEEFYKMACKDCKAGSKPIEVIYISSDEDQKEFHDYFGKMPWLAMEGDAAAAQLKMNLATQLKAYSLPTLVVLNTRTGNFITDRARKEVFETMVPEEEEDKKKDAKADDSNNKTPKLDAEMVKTLVASWKEREPETIGNASAGGVHAVMETLMNTMEYFQGNPLMLVAIICFIVFTPIKKVIMNNPAIGVALYYIFSKIGKEKLDKNMPYQAQAPITQPAEDKKKQ